MITPYRDGFGNWCSRIEAPAGRIRISTSAIVRLTGIPEPVAPLARQHPVRNCREETLVFLLGSRYCETDLLTDSPGSSSDTPLGWPRVQAICDFVHNHIRFDYMQARPTQTALEAFKERVGVCRDFAHLAVVLLPMPEYPRALLHRVSGRLRHAAAYGAMDFAGWFEAFLGGKWHTFDPRNRACPASAGPDARGRDAVDVAISTTFGPNTLSGFNVVCDEVIATDLIRLCSRLRAKLSASLFHSPRPCFTPPRNPRRARQSGRRVQPHGSTASPGMVQRQRGIPELHVGSTTFTGAGRRRSCRGRRAMGRG